MCTKKECKFIGKKVKVHWYNIIYPFYFWWLFSEVMSARNSANERASSFNDMIIAADPNNKGCLK